MAGGDFRDGYFKFQVTGGRLYRKIAIPCRPQKTFSLLVQEVPSELPEDDVRASLYRYSSVVSFGTMVCREGFCGCKVDGTYFLLTIQSLVLGLEGDDVLSVILTQLLSLTNPLTNAGLVIVHMSSFHSCKDFEALTVLLS